MCHIFLMEQPSGSEHVLSRHWRFQFFCNEIAFESLMKISWFWMIGTPCLYKYIVLVLNPKAQVFKQRFWMMLQGAGCPKPTICWSNDDELLKGIALNSASKFFWIKPSCHITFQECTIQAPRHHIALLLSGPWPIDEVCPGSQYNHHHYPQLDIYRYLHGQYLYAYLAIMFCWA